jgi:hypothetical protein
MPQQGRCVMGQHHIRRRTAAMNGGAVNNTGHVTVPAAPPAPLPPAPPVGGAAYIADLAEQYRQLRTRFIVLASLAGVSGLWNVATLVVLWWVAW